METIQDGRQKKKILEVCVKGIVCLTNMIAEIDTDAHCVSFVKTKATTNQLAFFIDIKKKKKNPFLTETVLLI